MATTPPTLGDDAFESNASGRMIYVPAGSVGDTSTNGTYKHEWLAYKDDIEVWADGSCGDGVTWALIGTTLTISKTGEGTGAMANYTTYGVDQPWDEIRSDIKSIVIEEGVTSIGDWAFSNCGSVTSVSIPASVTSIGYYSFNYCSMTSLTIPSNSSLETIGSFAFNCVSLPSVTFPASVTSIGNNAFDGCVTAITLKSNPAIGADAFPYPTTVTMNLTANGPVDEKYWATFYNENYNFEADGSTQIFKAALSETTLELTELTDQIVNKDNAVILKSTASPIVMTLTATDSGNDFTGNSLQGVDDPAGKTSNGTMYVLNYKAATGVGFYKLKAGSTLGVGKAFLYYSGALAPDFFGFDSETTDIESITKSQERTANGPYYDLQGRRVSQPTKGLYIVNGKKVVIK